MKHHSQVFIALFALIILINMYPLKEGYTNTQTQLAHMYADNSDNTDTVVKDEYDHKWLNTDNGGSSSEFKFSDNFNYKFTNPIVDTEISTSTINRPDFKFYDYYWPLSEKFSK